MDGYLSKREKAREKRGKHNHNSRLLRMRYRIQCLIDLHKHSHYTKAQKSIPSQPRRDTSLEPLSEAKHNAISPILVNMAKRPFQNLYARQFTGYSSGSDSLSEIRILFPGAKAEDRVSFFFALLILGIHTQGTLDNKRTV